MPREDPILVLERWEDHGAHYRLVELSPERAVVELRTCLGEPVERLASSERRFIEYLEERRGAGSS